MVNSRDLTAAAGSSGASYPTSDFVLTINARRRSARQSSRVARSAPAHPSSPPLTPSLSASRHVGIRRVWIHSAATAASAAARRDLRRRRHVWFQPDDRARHRCPALRQQHAAKPRRRRQPLRPAQHVRPTERHDRRCIWLDAAKRDRALWQHGHEPATGRGDVWEHGSAERSWCRASYGTLWGDTAGTNRYVALLDLSDFWLSRTRRPRCLIHPNTRGVNIAHVPVSLSAHGCGCTCAIEQAYRILWQSQATVPTLSRLSPALQPALRRCGLGPSRMTSVASEDATFLGRARM